MSAAFSNRSILLVLALFMAIGATFGPVVSHDFVRWDDDVNFYGNPRLNPATPQKIALFWTSRYFDTYRPLTGTAMGALALKRLPAMRPVEGTDARSSLDPRPVHAASLVLHFLAAVGAFCLLQILLGALCGETSPAKRDIAAGLGALAWALCPVQVETVAWATAVTDVLKGLFSIWALVFFARFARDLAQNRPAARNYIAATIFFVLGLLSHPAVTILPVLALLLAVFGFQITPRRAAPALALWVVLAFPFVLLTRSSEAGVALVSASTLTEATPSLLARPLVALDALAFYARHLAWPLPLAFDYGHTPKRVLDGLQSAPLSFFPLLIVPILGLVAWRTRKFPAVTLGALFFLVALFPNLGLLPFRFQIYSTVADRYLYVPLLGVALLLAFGAARFPTRGALFIGVLALFWGVLSALQLPIWRDSRALFSQQVRVNPQSPAGLLNMGAIEQAEGHFPAAQNWFERALELRPDWRDARLNLAGVLVAQGQFQTARPLVESLLRAEPNLPEALLHLAQIEAKTGQTKRAIAVLERVAAQNPENSAAQNNLGQLLLEQNQPAEAAPHFQGALKQRPDFATSWAGLGEALARQNRTSEAENALKRALALRPDDARSIYNLAQLRNAAGDNAGALKLLLRSVQLAPKVPETREALGIALSRAGRASDAEGVLKQLVRDFPNFASGRFSLGVVLAKRNALQEAATQWREVLKHDPNFGPAKDALAKLEAARLGG